jgi:DUF177 domain-containing protein
VRQDTGVRAPGRFDALELARTGGNIAGELNPATLPRLADRLVSDQASRSRLSWRIEGGHDALGRPALTLTLDGTVFLVCQRCLNPFAVPVTQETMLLLAGDEAELALLDDAEPEVVFANALVDPVALVEDELLLSLPFSPRHEECATAGAAATGAHAAESPFAGLARLKTGHGSSR